MTDMHSLPITSDAPAAMADAAFPDLPHPDTKRWVIRRKAAVVSAVAHGQLTLEEACARYRLSVEEFKSWQRLIELHGVPGLRATRLQIYRQAAPQAAR